MDTLHISEDAKTFAEATFMKKRMYYNMRIKTIQRNATNMVRLFKKAKKLKLLKLSYEYKYLSKKMHDIARELEERQLLPALKTSDDVENLITYGEHKKNPVRFIITHSLMLLIKKS